jgi:hypothetical protein
MTKSTAKAAKASGHELFVRHARRVGRSVKQSKP